MNESELIVVRARLKMRTTEEGGRKTGFKSGLRPNHVFEYSEDRYLKAFIGDIHFEGQDLIMPGEEKEVLVRFLGNSLIHKYLKIGQKWWTHEGMRCTGEAEILEIMRP